VPIRRANAFLYQGPEYEAFRDLLRARAGDRCEMCRAKNGEQYFFTWSDSDPSFDHALYWDGSAWITRLGLAVSPELLASRKSVLVEGPDLKYCRYMTVVCGCSHTDHDPRHRDPERARWLCNRCHLAHDSRNNVARKRRLSAAAKGQLWLCEDVEKAEMPEGMGA
jgi:hypothetical protein